MVRANLPDNWWPVSGFDSVESLTRKVYRLYGAGSIAVARDDPYRLALEVAGIGFVTADRIARSVRALGQEAPHDPGSRTGSA